jgi:SAM-dependent methyltransferase
MKNTIKSVLLKLTKYFDLDKVIIDLANERIKNISHDLEMPKYLYHFPLDYYLESHSPIYDESIHIEGEIFPVPPPKCRPGYSPDDDKFYLEWGKNDHDFIMQIIEKHHPNKSNLAILDWGCSSGRVLRHFYKERQLYGWELNGTDIQSYLVEWMRRNFPSDINILCGSTFPHLPFPDSSLDIIYGISVFTHTKYLWDFWLAEFKRVLKPGGLCIQTVQCETAWKFYHENRDLDWVKQSHPQSMLNQPELNEDFFFYGDPLVSQTFYKEDVLKKYWGRYMSIVDFLPPPQFAFQNWIVLKKPE